MATSKAKKERKKREQAGLRNPEKSRYRNVGLTTRVKKDKTKYTRKGRLSPIKSADERPFSCNYGWFGKVSS